MFRTVLLVLTNLVLCVSLARAEIGIQTEPSESASLTKRGMGLLQRHPALEFKGILDPKRFTTRHTVGIFFQSGARGGLNQYYLNTITYKAAAPLTVQAQVGFQNQLYGKPLFGSLRAQQTKVIVPHFGILYQPKSNLLIRFHFSNVPSYGYRGFRY